MSDPLDKFLLPLPPAQREIAARKVRQAQSMGWREIRIESPDGATAHHYDLMGTHPVSGRRVLIPEASDVVDD